MSRKRQRRTKKVIWLTILVLIGFAVWFANNLRPLLEETMEVTITEGMGAGEIAKMFAKEGMVRSRAAFILYGYLTGTRNRLQAGIFTIPAGADVGEIIALLTADERVQENTVRVIEGWIIEEIDAYLAKESLFPKGVFKTSAENVRKKCQLSEASCKVAGSIPGKVTTLEGYLFPDTYRLYAGATPEDLIGKMLTRFGEKTNDEKFKKALEDSEYSLHDAVTMASIIEAEVPHTEDRPVVAGLLWKRIDAGMPLQVDATINYITGKNEASASAADLKINSPYNTYLYPDLPPGPIGNPGMGALMAAVQPKDSPYWFYLSAKDGTTIFSKTFEEHKAAKAKYLK